MLQLHKTNNKVDKLKNSEVLQLFSSKAFKSDCPPEDYRELSEKVMKYANGLPLILVVLGSFLRRKSVDQWKSALDRLKEYPKKEIMEVLQISFDGLEETEKNIFLDIACFFNGFDKDDVMNIMDSCGFFPEIGIRSLVDKSLLHIDHDYTLRMHDSLEEMGKKIVREKSCNELGRRSRIWLWDDFYSVMNNETGTEEVEAIVCHGRFLGPNLNLRVRGFSNMKKLRLLRIDGYFTCDFEIEGWPNNECLSNEIRFFDWESFPLNYFPPSFQLHGLVQLTLLGSKIKQLWKNPIKPLYNLKSIDLTLSLKIRKLEGFSLFPNLEKLILDSCRYLEEIDPSIAVLKRLTLLNLHSCKSLKSLPTSMVGLESLEVLKLSDCSSLGNLPEVLGCLNNLEELDVRGTGLRDIPSSIGLYSLEKLDLRKCGLVSLKYLDLSGNHFSCLPACFNRLSELRDLDLRRCENLTSLGPELPDSLESVRVDFCWELHTFLDPLSQCNLRCSTIFCVGCFGLVSRQGSRRTAVTSLGRYLQNSPSPSKRFDIILPGDEIPSWFTHQVRGSSSISLPLHPNWCTNKWMGFALSVCYGPENLQPDDSKLVCQIKINEEDWGFGPVVCCLPYHIVSSDHLWLLYLPRDTYFHTEWHNKSGHIQFSFNMNQSTECGARLVYEQDIQELNLTATHEPIELPANKNVWQPITATHDPDDGWEYDIG